MATLRLPGGARGARLAEIIVEHNPGSRWQAENGGVRVDGPRVHVERWMVERVYWPDAPADAHAARRFMRHMLRADPRMVRECSVDRWIIADEPEQEGEQPMLVRFPAGLKQRLAQAAESLGLSQNELVVRAVDDLLSFADEFSDDPQELPSA